MTGYIETLTDPSYYGRSSRRPSPSSATYGMIPEDCESGKCWVTAYIVREKCDDPSNFRCKGTIEDYLKSQNIPAVYGVDTRELTKIVREAGPSCLPPSPFEPLKDLSVLKGYKVKDAVKSVTGTRDPRERPGGRQARRFV